MREAETTTSSSTPSPIRAMILAAGLGTRMRPLSDLRAKPALPVCGRPVISLLLELLARNADIVLSRETIYERIWGYDFETSSKSLDVYIGYLRRKTEADGMARLIHTVRGVGYTLRVS